jgi:hypothetical protein
MDTGRDEKGKKVRRDERHAFGAHFTSEFDIRKVVGPTIVKPWRDRIDAAGKNVGELRKTLADSCSNSTSPARPKKKLAKKSRHRVCRWRQQDALHS